MGPEIKETIELAGIILKIALTHGLRVPKPGQDSFSMRNASSKGSRKQGKPELLSHASRLQKQDDQMPRGGLGWTLEQRSDQLPRARGTQPFRFPVRPPSGAPGKLGAGAGGPAGRQPRHLWGSLVRRWQRVAQRKRGLLPLTRQGEGTPPTSELRVGHWAALLCGTAGTQGLSMPQGARVRADGSRRHL